MRKQWIKKENMYHKPFYKQKLQMTLLGVFAMAIIFFVYQLFYIKQLQIETDNIRSVRYEENKLASIETTSLSYLPKTNDKILRGIRLKDYDLYNPVVGNIFFCMSTGKAIPLNRVNDDYCDCVEDGTDEPETNACENGRFYCKFQIRHRTGRGRDVSVPSNRINDGVCDCCDGSDEWLPVNGRLNNCTNSCYS